MLDSNNMWRNDVKEKKHAVLCEVPTQLNKGKLRTCVFLESRVIHQLIPYLLLNLMCVGLLLVMGVRVCTRVHSNDTIKPTRTTRTTYGPQYQSVSFGSACKRDRYSWTYSQCLRKDQYPSSQALPSWISSPKKVSCFDHIVSRRQSVVSGTNDRYKCSFLNFYQGFYLSTFLIALQDSVCRTTD